MTDSENLAWARVELEIRAEEDSSVRCQDDVARHKKERSYRRCRARLSRVEVRELLNRVVMEWAA